VKHRRHPGEPRDVADVVVPGAPAVEARGLVKVFGSHRAVDGVDLTVPAGTVHAVLGPNGAGKTTTVQMLATLQRPDGGSARVFGRDVVADASDVRRLIGLTGQYASVDNALTAVENLTVFARLLGIRHPKRQVEELLERFELSSAARRPVKGFSGGMRRRLDIAASLLQRPRLIFLDEPTTGLDPRTRTGMWDVVRELVADGATVLLTTQYLEEADQLADRITVIDHGRVVAEGTPVALKESIGTSTLEVVVADPSRTTEAAALVERVVGHAPHTEPVAGRLSVRVENADPAGEVLHRLRRAALPVAEIAVHRPTLDDVFFALTETSEPEVARA